MTHILTGLTVLALIACAWLLPVYARPRSVQP